jgi:hypothetical protein
MPDTRECPACHEDSSGVLAAWRETRPCPRCLLPHTVAEELETAQSRGANSRLVEQAGQAEARAARLARENGLLRRKLLKARTVIDEPLPEYDPHWG